MGEVYRATDTKLGREVALKVLRRSLIGEPERLERFRREARVLATLDHPAIVTVFSVEESDGLHFLTMQLVEGKTLDELIEPEGLELDRLFDIAIPLLDAVAAAHERGIIHRDLKPSNVMWTDGRVKVLDFGLAKLAAPDLEAGSSFMSTMVRTEEGVIAGTPRYMSPEQARGESADHRADIFSLGVMLYELATGGRPFRGGTSIELLSAILKDTAPAVTEIRPELPRRLGRVIERCLEKAPADRYQTASELADDLRGIRDEEASAVLSDSVPPEAEPRSWAESIAVLPFESLGQEEATVFTEGIHGGLLTRLSGIADLRVTSRSSVLQFRGSKDPLPEIADVLGVAWILQGEVQELADQVQVSARLVNAAEDRQVWAESYRRTLSAESLFEVQGELTREIVNQLEGQLTPADEAALEGVPTGDLEAFRLYTQGRVMAEQRTEAELARAVVYFRQAIERDSTYALAWAGLADTFSAQFFYSDFPREELLPQAQAAARRATELDPGIAEGHASLGIVHSLRGEGEAASRSLRRSIDLNPSFDYSHAWLGWVEDLLGRRERALEPARRSVELSPLAPGNRVYLADAYLANGLYEDALAEAVRAREFRMDYALAHYYEGMALLHLARWERARVALERSLELALPDGTPSHSEIRAAIALGHAKAGDRTAALELLEQIDTAADPFSAGLVYAALDEVDRALTYLGSIERWEMAAIPKVRFFYPEVLGPLRERPEFREILRNVDGSVGL